MMPPKCIFHATNRDSLRKNPSMAPGFDWLYIADIQSTFCPMNTLHPRNQDLQHKNPYTALVLYLQLLSLDYELTHHSLGEV